MLHRERRILQRLRRLWLCRLACPEDRKTTAAVTLIRELAPNSPTVIPRPRSCRLHGARLNAAVSARTCHACMAMHARAYRVLAHVRFRLSESMAWWRRQLLTGSRYIFERIFWIGPRSKSIQQYKDARAGHPTGRTGGRRQPEGRRRGRRGWRCRPSGAPATPAAPAGQKSPHAPAPAGPPRTQCRWPAPSDWRV